MADEVDIASERAEQALALALAQKKPVLERTGKCHNCEENLAEPQGVFCDKFCREDYEKEQRVKNKNIANPSLPDSFF